MRRRCGNGALPGYGPGLTGQSPVTTQEESVRETLRLLTSGGLRQEAFVAKFWSILDAIASTLLWSGTEPFGVSLSTSPGRI